MLALVAAGIGGMALARRGDTSGPLGEGVRRMFEEMRLAGLADPDYAQTAGSVRLTLSSTQIRGSSGRDAAPDGLARCPSSSGRRFSCSLGRGGGR